MSLQKNPNFQIAYTSSIHNVNLYAPKDISKYHMSRHVAAGAQNIYSSAGATKDFIKKVASQVKEWCNDTSDAKTLRTDVGTMMDNLLYRLQYPVDEHCAIRMGAIYCFLDEEAPDEMHDHFTRRKLDMAIGNYEKGIPADPDMYAFFLTTGIAYTPAWSELLNTLSDSTYLIDRAQALQALIPARLRTE